MENQDTKKVGKYEGYFLVKSIKEYENIYFIELEDIKSKKIEDSFQENIFKLFLIEQKKIILMELKI